MPNPPLPVSCPSLMLTVSRLVGTPRLARPKRAPAAVHPLTQRGEGHCQRLCGAGQQASKPRNAPSPTELRPVFLHKVISNLLFEGRIAEVEHFLKKKAEIRLRRHGFEQVANLAHIEGRSEVLKGRQRFGIS